jgi:hypothetical protein
MRLCALLETSDGEYHICCGQFSFFGDGVYFLATSTTFAISCSAKHNHRGCGPHPSRTLRRVGVKWFTRGERTKSSPSVRSLRTRHSQHGAVEIVQTLGHPITSKRWKSGHACAMIATAPPRRPARSIVERPPPSQGATGTALLLRSR